MGDCRGNKLTHSPLEADRNLEVFDFTPSPFSIKEARILTQASWLPEGVAVCYILGLLAFSIKSLLLAHQLASRLSGLLCGEEYKIRLGNKF